VNWPLLLIIAAYWAHTVSALLLSLRDPSYTDRSHP
jgi:hypothetical protein